jgi:hypothetical protein
VKAIARHWKTLKSMGCGSARVRLPVAIVKTESCDGSASATISPDARCLRLGEIAMAVIRATFSKWSGIRKVDVRVSALAIRT